MNENERRKIVRLFYGLAAAQILQIASGALLGLFVAPASLFVSRDETEAFWWIAAALFGVGQIPLGAILLLLSVLAANAFRREKNRRRLLGLATAGASLFAFPFSTIAAAVLIRLILKAEK